MKLPRIPLAVRLPILILLGVGAIAWHYFSMKNGWCLHHPHLDDRVGVMERAEVCRIDRFLGAFQDEMAADIRVLVVPNTGGVAIEQFSLDHARRIGLGRDEDRRGLLLVYDVEGKQMRIEVGSKLEGVFTDAFVGFLIREHLRSFASTDRMAIGIRATLMMTFTRIRHAVLGEEYDPRAAAFIEDRRRLVVGGGTTAGAIAIDTVGAFRNREGTPAELAYFAPQQTVAESYARFLDWLVVGATPVNAPLFTGPSQEWLRDLPITNAYGEFMVLEMHGKAHEIVEQGDLAMLYYTGTPFISPHYFRKTARGWEIDILADVLNTQNLVGYPYTWALYYSGDDYSKRFNYLWQRAGRAGRIAGGDNRPLPIRSLPWQERVISLWKGDQWKAIPVRQAPAIDTLSVEVALNDIRLMRGRPSLVVLYFTDTDFNTRTFPQLLELERASPEISVAALSIDPPENGHWISWLYERHQTMHPPRWITPYTEPEIAGMLRSLGIDSSSACGCARAMVFDAQGQLAFTSEDLTDLAGVRAALDRLH